MMGRYHSHEMSPNQCGSTLVQTIDAPISLVWSLIRRFDNPQVYKRFIRSCSILDGNGGVGSLREVKLVSGLPAKTSRERLDVLDDDSHVMIFSIVGGDHRLINYRSTTTVHVIEEEKHDHNEIGKTVVIESYLVDVPMGSSKEDTCLFADTIIRCNLRSLARITEKMASVQNGESSRT
ncbi:abscisic acid receptor PYL12-like [Macadamia integrifolia]|uniref:abscisic acid receptor PYL12-like n=1 Tax=Macadamia integrifolia TaxID=60698 RepID=UPI001C5308A5|nr:abscisic acid receptor PYL12-like [Macadamia integrifolia]